jgi:hypothetical protein
VIERVTKEDGRKKTAGENTITLSAKHYDIKNVLTFSHPRKQRAVGI